MYIDGLMFQSDLRRLLELISDETGFFSPHWVHVFGPSTCGKTSTIRNYFSDSKAQAYVDCVEACSSEKHFFCYLLREISKCCSKGRSAATGTKFLDDDVIGVRDATDFLAALRDLIRVRPLKRLILTLDNVERCKAFKSNVLPVVVNLNAFGILPSSTVVTVLSVSKLPYWHTFTKLDAAGVAPMQISLGEPSNDEIKIILDDILREKSTSDGIMCVKHMCLDYLLMAKGKGLTSLMYEVETKLRPLLLQYDKRLRDKNYDVSSDSALNNDSTVFKTFKLLLQIDDRLNAVDNDNLCDAVAGRGWKENENRFKLSQIGNIPPNLKLVIMAAYIASYNAPSTDGRFFLKKSDKKRITGRISQKDRCLNTQFFRGPKPFLLERLLIIYSKLASDYDTQYFRANASGDPIMSHISTLCSLKVLQRCSNDKMLDSIKYKCLCPFSIVDQMASSLEFDLKQYLNNFE